MWGASPVKLLCALMKLHHCLLLVVGFDGAGAHSADLVDGVGPGNLPALHQVARQHGPRPTVAVHAVNGHALVTNGTVCFVSLEGWRSKHTLH